MSDRSAVLARLAVAMTFALATSAAPAGAQLTPIGLSEGRAQWFENEDLVLYGPDALDHFAAAIAIGDFNGDGADDLATGLPDDDDVGGACGNCGRVVVRWGVPGSGLATGLATTVLHQGLAGSPDPPAEDDRYGAALAAGDFNGDAYDDLAVGAPGTGGQTYGGVQVYYGWSTGFQTEHSEYITEAIAGGGENTLWGAEFGAVLAVGNFDHDPYDDLAIGAHRARQVQTEGPQGPEGEIVRPGAVYVAHGQDFGLLPWFGYRIAQDEVDIQEVGENGDQFGRGLAAGDFSPDSYDDLAIGVPGENDHGIVQILFGSQWGLLFAENILWQPGAVGEVPEAGDRFGFAFGVGDFDGDLYEDLAIGDPSEDLGVANEIADAGSIVVAFGSSSGFDLSRTLAFRQSALHGAENERSDEAFGWAVAAGDFDGDDLDDLAVGHPGDLDTGVNSGAVTILMGAFGSGLGTRFRALQPGNEGLPSPAEGGRGFGRALAVGDFDGGGYADLAIGDPFHDVGGSFVDAGGAMVLYGSLFSDGFEIGWTGRWSGTVD